MGGGAGDERKDAVVAPGDPADTGDAVGIGLPPADFATFVLSLGSSALIHLGEAPTPQGEKAAPNLAMAKHTIDLLSILLDKTRGNLTDDERELLESLLYDLRLRFVTARKS